MCRGAWLRCMPKAGPTRGLALCPQPHLLMWPQPILCVCPVRVIPTCRFSSKIWWNGWRRWGRRRSGLPASAPGHSCWGRPVCCKVIRPPHTGRWWTSLPGLGHFPCRNVWCATATVSPERVSPRGLISGWFCLHWWLVRKRQTSSSFSWSMTRPRHSEAVRPDPHRLHWLKPSETSTRPYQGKYALCPQQP